MMKPVKAMLFVLCLVAIVAALPQGHTIRGKVRSSSGQNLARIVVELQTGTGSMVNQTVTDNEGNFYFIGLLDTSYSVVISAPDYDGVSERVEFVRTNTQNSPGETRLVEIILSPKGGAPLPASRPAFAQNIPPSARNSLDQGLKLSKEGKSQEAILAMREAIKQFPDYFDAHFALANELIKTRQLNEAIAELQRARDINPKDDRIYQSFGLVLMNQGKYLVAARVFGEAAKLNPNDPQILVRRSSALIDYATTIDASKSTEAAAERMGALDMAEKELKRAFEASGKKLSSALMQLARLYEKKGDRARAADYLEQYLRLAPDAKNADAIREAIKKLRSQTN
ncbi:MAG: tetratricopeptide repeat protein [Acidobacteriota bacterium]